MQEEFIMSKISGARPSLILSAMAVAFALCFGPGAALAGDDVTQDQIVRALAPSNKPLTRGLSVSPQIDPAAEAEGKFVQSLRGRATRSLSLTEREEIATIAKTKPNIDLEINFDYNSTNISAKSLPSRAARWAGSRGICTSTGAEGTTISPPSWVSCSKPGMSPV